MKAARPLLARLVAVLAREAAPELEVAAGCLCGGGLGIGALAGGAGIALLGALGAAPPAAALGLLERAGLGDLASITSPFANAPTPALKPSTVRSPLLAETTGAVERSMEAGALANTDARSTHCSWLSSYGSMCSVVGAAPSVGSGASSCSASLTPLVAGSLDWARRESTDPAGPNAQWGRRQDEGH